MWLLLIFIAVPLIEIGLFIQVGGAIGLWPTLLIVLLTAIAGTYLVKSQGMAALRELQTSFGQMRDPSAPLAHGAMILFSGALLLTPGFFTDAVGFLLLIPAVRDVIIKAVRARLAQSQNVQFHTMHAQNDTIDGTYTHVPPQDGPSKWTKD